MVGCDDPEDVVGGVGSCAASPKSNLLFLSAAGPTLVKKQLVSVARDLSASEERDVLPLWFPAIARATAYAGMAGSRCGGLTLEEELV